MHLGHSLHRIWLQPHAGPTYARSHRGLAHLPLATGRPGQKSDESKAQVAAVATGEKLQTTYQADNESMSG